MMARVLSGRLRRAFDVSDVEAAARRLAHAERQHARCMEQRSVMYALGFKSALEQLGGDITITDGIPTEITCDS